MKKYGKTGLLILSLLLVAVMLCGCASTADKSAAGEEVFGNYDSAMEESEDAAVNYSGAQKANKQSKDANDVTKNRKIIEYVNLSVETKTFDKFIADINATVEKSGGYIENSEIGGNSYYGSENRTAQLKIRIPKTKQSDFSEFISKNANVVNRSVNTEDVTNQYIDTQSRIKALTLEKETLEKLISQASTMTDTLTVYERLTGVIAEIESYQGKLNQMDNLIEYTTFTVYIDEVEKETKVVNQNWFANTWNGLVDNLTDIGNGLLNFLSFVISGLPYWILCGIIALIVILIIRHHKKKKAKKSVGGQ